jgi:DNA-binding CsgD family transcriptional regulator
MERRTKQPGQFAGPSGSVQLTPGQMAIMESIGRGNLPFEAARELKLAQSTVVTQLRRVCQKLGERHWFAAFVRFRAGRRAR